MTSPETKLCKECRFEAEAESLPGKCINFESWASDVLSLCTEMREEGGRCGPEGRLFEPRE